ncbi:MAG: 50S ribosomal protein L10 [Clostridia bacterium]|nr:50S ribosomal protein L10 [Clostridia bacterium]
MASEKILEMKKLQVKEIAEKMNGAGSIVLADYRGLSVEQDTAMRAKMREEGIEYKVVKNNIIKHAIEGTSLEGLMEYLVGPTAVAMSKDEVAAAKIMFKFAKDIEAFELKAGVVSGMVIGLDGLEKLAKLPSKEELIAKMLGSMNSPITGLVNVLSANIRGLAVALNAIIEQKQNVGA